MIRSDAFLHTTCQVFPLQLYLYLTVHLDTFHYGIRALPHTVVVCAVMHTRDGVRHAMTG